MPRLYVNQALTAKSLIMLNPEQSHYLCHVLRQKIGSMLTVFNEVNGDWLAILIEVKKKQVVIKVDSQQKLPVLTPPLWLAFAPLKQEATNLVLEKATELGVTHIQPLWMEHSNTQRLNQDRWQKIVMEAAEQCERQDVPTILSSLKLTAFLENLPANIHWFMALERSHQPCLLKALETANGKKWGFIIGPEGGFSATEQHILLHHPSIHPITLGTRVLRAETAALSALAVAQSALDK